jgi:hypothetical protein
MAVVVVVVAAKEAMAAVEVVRGEVDREGGRGRPAERATVFDDVRATGAFSLATSMPS